MISHFVKKGAAKPRSYTLQPWKKSPDHENPKMSTSKAETETRSLRPHPAVFATGIAKYVFKKERLTVPPERVLQNSGLLPPKPGGHPTPPTTDSPAVPLEGTAIPTGAAAAVQDITSTAAEDIIDAALSVKPADEEWDWEQVEQERQRGMRIAEGWSKTDALHEEFTDDDRPVLGRYRDIP